MSLRTKHVQQGNVYDSGVPLLGQSAEALRASEQQDGVTFLCQGARALRATEQQEVVGSVLGHSGIFLASMSPMLAKVAKLAKK